MKTREARFVAQVAGCVAATLFVSLAAPAMQTSRPSGPPDLKGAQRQREVRETMLRKGEVTAEIDKRERRRLEEDIKKVREDFRRIQIVRNGIVRHLLAEKPLDYKFLAAETGEINKRAERLKAFLMPPVPENPDAPPKSQIEYDAAGMKEALIRLCNLIAGFIDNPVLQTPDRTDVEESMRAGGDLLNIIELSANIRRNAERLQKQSK